MGIAQQVREACHHFPPMTGSKDRNGKDAYSVFSRIIFVSSSVQHHGLVQQHATVQRFGEQPVTDSTPRYRGLENSLQPTASPSREVWRKARNQQHATVERCGEQPVTNSGLVQPVDKANNDLHYVVLSLRLW